MNTPAPAPSPPDRALLLDPLVIVEDGDDGSSLTPLASLGHTRATATPDIPRAAGSPWPFAGRGRLLDPLVTVRDGSRGPTLVPLAGLALVR